MSIIEKYVVSSLKQSTRLSDYIVGKMKELPSRKSVKKAITNQEILVNGKVESTGYWVQEKDTIDYIPKSKWPAHIYELSMPVIYEDKHLAVINKPGGIPVSGNTFRNVQNCLGHFLDLDKENPFYPQAVHRLDAATCGLLIIAKSKAARINLGHQFEEGKVKKKYTAIVSGKVAHKGLIKWPIDKKESLSYFELTRTHQTKSHLHFSLIELTPKTGRTHQLRKHCLFMAHPILGDQLYNNSSWQLKGKGLLLCASFLSFNHPITKEILNLKITPPAKFEKVMMKP